MFFNSEKSRDIYVSAPQRIRTLFPDVTGCVDAEYLAADRSRVMGISNLPIEAPVCLALCGNDTFINWAESLDRDFVMVYGDIITEGGKEVPAEIAEAVKAAVDGAVRGVGYLSKEGNHVIDLKGMNVGPHYYVNLLLGNRVGFEDPMLTTPKSALDAFGRGAFRAGGEAQVLASRYVYNMEEAGEPANRQFYLVENNKQIFYSADARTNVKSAICTHKPNHTVIEYETECGLKITRKIFIMPHYEGMAEATEAQIITVENLTNTDRKIKLVATGVFGIANGAESLAQDIVYTSIVHESEIFMDENGKPFAISPSFHPKYARRSRRFATMFANGEPMDEYCVNYADFIGRGTLEKPDHVAKLTSRPNRKAAAFFAMGKTLAIKAGAKAEVVTYVGIESDPVDAHITLDKVLKTIKDGFTSVERAKEALDDVINFYNDYSSYLSVDTGDKDRDAYINHNLPFQVLYQSFLSRSFAWTQKAFRQVGFREIQDMYPSTYYLCAMGNAHMAKTMISEWVKNVYEYGYANHNFYWQGNGAGDCSDDQLWLIQAVYRYVSHTKDYGFLKEEYKIAGSDKKRTVFETMMAAIEYSGHISVGKHHLPVLDHADWNDCLKLDTDSISAPLKFELYKKQLEEKGQEWGVPFENHFCESVMNAFLLKIAEDELAEMAEACGMTKEAAYLKNMSAELQDNIQKHAWKEDFFARCLINNNEKYTYVGAGKDGFCEDGSADGTYFLNSFSWSILANSATEEQIAIMLEKVEQHLKTPAGLMLSSPCDLGLVSPTTASDHYFHGDRENGAVFKHATMMATAAMFKAAKIVKDEALAKKLSEMAYWMLDKVFPFKTMENPYVLKGNPRFCTQYNNSETMENIGPMLSGTASWLALTVFEFLGIEYAEGGMRFNPILSETMKNIRFEIKRGGSVFAVEVVKPEGFCRTSETTKYFIDGTECGEIIPDNGDGKRHEVKIVF